MIRKIYFCPFLKGVCKEHNCMFWTRSYKEFPDCTIRKYMIEYRVNGL
jgi:hypothetical protein